MSAGLVPWMSTRTPPSIIPSLVQVVPFHSQADCASMTKSDDFPKASTPRSGPAPEGDECRPHASPFHSRTEPPSVTAKASRGLTAYTASTEAPVLCTPLGSVVGCQLIAWDWNLNSLPSGGEDAVSTPAAKRLSTDVPWMSLRRVEVGVSAWEPPSGSHRSVPPSRPTTYSSADPPVRNPTSDTGSASLGERRALWLSTAVVARSCTQ